MTSEQIEALENLLYKVSYSSLAYAEEVDILEEYLNEVREFNDSSD